MVGVGLFSFLLSFWIISVDPPVCSDGPEGREAILDQHCFSNASQPGI